MSKDGAQKPNPKNELGQEEIDSIMKSIGALIVECDLEGAKVELFREMICDLQMACIFNSAGVQGRRMMRVVKDYPISMAENVKKFNEKVHKITEGIDAI